jgi:hypothetical protein
VQIGIRRLHVRPRQPGRRRTGRPGRHLPCSGRHAGGPIFLVGSWNILDAPTDAPAGHRIIRFAARAERALTLGPSSRERGEDEGHGTEPTLTDQRDAILVAGARLKVTLMERNGERTIEIEGNQTGLRALALICSGLADLTPEELLTPANHYHLDEQFWGTEPGSVPLTVCRRELGWPEASD